MVILFIIVFIYQLSIYLIYQLSLLFIGHFVYSFIRLSQRHQRRRPVRHTLLAPRGADDTLSMSPPPVAPCSLEVVLPAAAVWGNTRLIELPCMLYVWLLPGPKTEGYTQPLGFTTWLGQGVTKSNCSVEVNEWATNFSHKPFYQVCMAIVKLQSSISILTQ